MPGVCCDAIAIRFAGFFMKGGKCDMMRIVLRVASEAPTVTGGTRYYDVGAPGGFGGSGGSHGLGALHTGNDGPDADKIMGHGKAGTGAELLDLALAR